MTQHVTKAALVIFCHSCWLTVTNSGGSILQWGGFSGQSWLQGEWSHKPLVGLKENQSKSRFRSNWEAVRIFIEACSQFWQNGIYFIKNRQTLLWKAGGDIVVKFYKLLTENKFHVTFDSLVIKKDRNHPKFPDTLRWFVTNEMHRSFVGIHTFAKLGIWLTLIMSTLKCRRRISVVLLMSQRV